MFLIGDCGLRIAESGIPELGIGDIGLRAGEQRTGGRLEIHEYMDVKRAT